MKTPIRNSLKKKQTSSQKKRKSVLKSIKNSSQTGKKKTHQRPNKKGLSLVKNLKDLKNLLLKGYYEYRIILKASLFSRKWIYHDGKKTKGFSIINCIDGSQQRLTEKQLMNRSYTNIGYALKKHCLVVNLNDRLTEFQFDEWPCGCTDENCKDCKIGICEHD